MTSPAQRHMMRVSASQAAQREQAPLRHATAYEQMLVKLADDRRTLKTIRSNELKAAKKRELLPFYAPWVAGVLADGRGAQDDILMTVMLWRLDAGDVAGALEIAPYALKYGLTSDHRRTTPYMLVEEVALAALRLRDAGEPVDLALLLTTLSLTDGADVPDMVRARLHKVTGLTLRDAGQDAEALAHLLLERRQARGSLDFDLPEAQFIVNRSTGEVEGIKRRVRLFAHRLIEEFMLAANEAVARFLTEKGTPFPYRIHPAPDPDRLSTLFRTLASTDLAQSDLLTLKRGETPSPSRLRDILVQANGTPQEYLVGRLVLRSMMQARYSPEAGEHFGLASPCYCHFTSPIRRYADLLVHRALSFTLGATPGPILAGHKLLMAADQCNARERAATEAEREIARRLGCLLLRERTGETFTGVVSGVTEFGFFVEFDEMPVEGMVRLTTFRDDWFEYDPDRQELIGVGTGRRFRLGQAVTVRLTDVHIGRLEVNLELEGTTDTAKRSSSRRSAGGREAPGRSSGRKRNGFVPRHKRR